MGISVLVYMMPFWDETDFLGEKMRLNDKKDIMEKLSRIFSEYADKEMILSEDTDIFKDLDLDSVDIMHVIVNAEEVFGIEFDDVDLLSENFQVIGDFCELIQRLLEPCARSLAAQRAA